MADWRMFEKDVGQLVELFGYKAEVTKASGDGGVDVMARRGDRTVAIQCKLYQGRVGVKAVIEVAASQRLHGATDCILLTTGMFTKDALKLGRQGDVKMIGGPEILTLCKQKRIVLRSASFLVTSTTAYQLSEPEQMVGRQGPLILSDIRVSGLHAKIVRNGLNLGVIDQNSTNGTKLNGERLTPGKTYRLGYGDELEFAHIRCKVSMYKSEVLAPPVKVLRF